MIESSTQEANHMADTFVKVATFNQSFEAELAKNLLENEGITSLVSGAITADMLPLGQAGASDQIVLQVRADDAQRAVGLLAEVAAAKLESNWEEQAESGAGVWICSICGEPISNRLSMCYACQTPREGIRADEPHERHAIQPPHDEIQRRAETTNIPVVPSTPPNAPSPRREQEESESLSLTPGDDLARHAFGAAMFCLLTVFISFPLSIYYLLKLFFSDEDLSPKGRRYLYGALLINGTYVLIFFVLYLAAYRGS
jgi:rubrerythrin